MIYIFIFSQGIADYFPRFFIRRRLQNSKITPIAILLRIRRNLCFKDNFFAIGFLTLKPEPTLSNTLKTPDFERLLRINAPIPHTL